MARPAKSLVEHLLQGSFRPTRHHQLLAGPDVPWPAFALLQARYRAASSEPERRHLALEFAQAMQAVHEQTQAEQAAAGGRSLDQELLQLGKPGSSKQLLGFFPHYLRHAKGPLLGQPFQLEKWQREFLREFNKRDKGRRVYSRAVLGVPRGNGKTPLAAGLGLYELVTRSDAPEVYFAAGSKEQAGIGIDFARSFVEQGPLADWVTQGRGLTCRLRRGKMEAVSSEGTLQHGRAPSAATIDELWSFSTARQEETYKALVTAIHKRPDAYVLATTTAGFDRQSLLGRIYDTALSWDDLTVSSDGCLTIAKSPEAGALLYWYGAPAGADPEDPKLIRACNPGSWITVADLQQQLHDPGLSENDFRRLHLNQWTTSDQAWLPGSTWRDLHSELEIPEQAAVYLGVDVGISHDSTAVCICHPHPDGRFLLRCHIWSADPDAQAHTHVPGGLIRLEQIEQHILALARRYRVKAVSYDPRYFHRSAELLEQKKLKLIEYSPAAAPLTNSYQTFFQYAREGLLAHDGDPILTSHIEGTAAHKTERGWKLSKLRNSSKIDGTIAAVLALDQAQHHNHKRAKPNIYWIDNDDLTY